MSKQVFGISWTKYFQIVYYYVLTFIRSCFLNIIIKIRELSDICINKLAKDDLDLPSDEPEYDTNPHMDYIVENTLPLTNSTGIDIGIDIRMVGYLPNRSFGFCSKINDNRFGTVYVMQDDSRIVTPHRGSFKLKLAQLLLTKYDDDGNKIPSEKPEVLKGNYYYDDDHPAHGLT